MLQARNEDDDDDDDDDDDADTDADVDVSGRERKACAGRWTSDHRFTELSAVRHWCVLHW